MDFEEIIRALNDIGYDGPLSVEWEDSGMDREHGAAEACAFVNSVDFEPSAVAFDAGFCRIAPGRFPRGFRAGNGSPKGGRISST